MWGADVIALQETKLAPHAIAETATILRENRWKLSHGKPCRPQEMRKGTQVTHAANEANTGGVAIAAKGNLKLITEGVAEQEPELYDSGRWMEAKVLVKGRTKFLTVACVYGISGAASNDKKCCANEAILADTVRRAISAQNAPYLICGDVNIT